MFVCLFGNFTSDERSTAAVAHRVVKAGGILKKKNVKENESQNYPRIGEGARPEGPSDRAKPTPSLLRMTMRSIVRFCGILAWSLGWVMMLLKQCLFVFVCSTSDKEGEKIETI